MIAHYLRSHSRNLPFHVHQWATNYISLQYHSLLHNLHDFHRLILEIKSRPRNSPQILRSWTHGRILTIHNVLILLWVVVLYNGEVTSFRKSIEACHWDTWEDWPQDSSPHHLIFVADPQLVDPHTYPGRPWPLSTLTVKHTDLYLRRSYSRIQRDLNPSTVIFLGDLFDGGREWATDRSHSPEERYRRYGNNFWLKEYYRFGSIFFRPWRNDGSSQGGPTSRIIATLPGNHDLGFGKGIQKAVRDRFMAYFGEGNQVDIFGNHTFVALDTVSLSAKEQEQAEERREIWEPAEKFLNDVQTKKNKAISTHFRISRDIQRDKFAGYGHAVLNVTEPSTGHVYKQDELFHKPDLPTILLSHIPFFRSPGTPCGPLRERYPPTLPPPGQTAPVEPDDRNAIALHGGYQYQNTLTSTLTSHIVNKLGSSIDYVFSGDDHDYCEVIHRDYPNRRGGIHEITVKTISWAMGVRHPGVLMVSLWHPVAEPDDSPAQEGAPTLQTKLCLLPDQLSIFIRYARLLVLTLIILAVRATGINMTPSRFTSSRNANTSLLPTADTSKHDGRRSRSNTSRVNTASSSSTSSTSASEDLSNQLSSRNLIQPASHNTSPTSSYGIPLQEGANTSGSLLNSRMHEDGYTYQCDVHPRSGKGIHVGTLEYSWTKAQLLLGKWAGGIWSVAWKVLLWYFWLLRK